MNFQENNFASDLKPLNKSIGKKKTSYSSQFRRKVIRDLLLNKLKNNEAGSKYNVPVNVICTWKYKYGKDIEKNIKSQRVEELSKEENSIVAEIKKSCDKKLEDKNKELQSLYNEIGRLTMKIKGK